jgi:predicted RND superfamily exporter protein
VVVGMNTQKSEAKKGIDFIFAKEAYRWRWLTSLIVLGSVVFIFMSGINNIERVTNAVMGVSDISDGSGVIAPQMFDPSLDVWFDTGDATVAAYFAIEDQFIAEDTILVTFENKGDSLGVFSPESLNAIQRLTTKFLTVPGVRHVRSLTYSPWIRWGEIGSDDSTEKGLIISDLVANSPDVLTEQNIVERMIAVLGAQHTAGKVGVAQVRQVIGNDTHFEQFTGEPLLLDTIVNKDATTTAIQIQIVRPNVENTHQENSNLVNKLYSVQFQRAALRGIEHFLNIESGLSVKTAEYLTLMKWIKSLPEGANKNSWQQSLIDPTKNFIKNQHDKTIKKFHVYRQTEDGSYIDVADPALDFTAPYGFSPKPLSPYSFRLGGVPVLERNFEIVGGADAKYLPLMFLIIFVALVFLSKSIAGVFIPMTVVFASIFGTVGFLFYTGAMFNNLTAMIPNMITAIGVADSIHLVIAWLLLRNQFNNKAELITEVIRKNAMPVLLTTITTAIGFYSLLLNDLTPVKQLGWSMAAGTLIAYLLTMTLVPLLLSFFPHNHKKAYKGAGLFTKNTATLWASFIIRNRIFIVTSAGLLTLVSCTGLFYVEIDADQRKMFVEDNPVIQDLIWIEDHLGGTGDLEIIFNSTADEKVVALTEEEAKELEHLNTRRVAISSGINDMPALSRGEKAYLTDLEQKYKLWNEARIGVSPVFLQLIEGFENRLREEMAIPDAVLSIITDLTSPLDILKKIHQVQHSDNPNFYRSVNESDVPDILRHPTVNYDVIEEAYVYTPAQTASTLISQYYLLYENGARPGDTLSTQLSFDRKHFRMQGRGLLCTTQQKQAAIARIKEIAENEFPALINPSNTLNPSATPNIADLTVSGKKTLMDRTGIVIAESFVKSIVVALIAILIVIGIFFRSWKIALVSILPNVLPIVIPLGIFGWLGIMIDGPAIVVTAVALGVCVDDSIHFFSKYRHEKAKGNSSTHAIIYTIEECGDAITLTTLVLMIGFSTMLLSSFSPNYLMGILAVSMIALAWLADFIVTPALLMLVDNKSSEEPTKTDFSVAH